MALSLPYPNSPNDGDAFLSLPVRSNVNAITQAIQSFDGTQVQAGSIAAAALAPAANPITRGAETLGNFVVSGCIWSAGGGLLANMTGGIIYINGIRVSVLPVTGKVLSVSTDYYVDVDTLGNLYYLAVGIGAMAPALTGNSIRIAKLTANATVFAAVVQTGVDSLNNSIKPVGPVSTSTIDFNSFALNMKSATNISAFTFINGENDLGANGATVSFTVVGNCNAFVTVAIGSASSSSDYEFRPEIRVDGAIIAIFQPAAAAANTSSRATARTFSYTVPLATGTHTISAGCLISGGSAVTAAAGGVTIAAFVLGRVTA